MVHLLFIKAALATAFFVAQAPPYDLEQIPVPLLDAFEEGVRAQLEEARQRALDKDAEGLARLCLLYQHYELFQSARPCLEQLAERQAGDGRWPYYLGLLHAREGRNDLAVEAFERAQALLPGFPATSVRLGDLRLAQGDLEGAEHAYRRAMNDRGTKDAARFGLARIALERGNPRGAIRDLEAILPTQPAGSTVHHHLGLAWRASGDLERARAELARNQHVPVSFADSFAAALTALDVSREAIFNRAVEASRLGRHEQAIGDFRELLTKHPDDAEAHYNLARALGEIGDLVASEHHLREAIRIRPTFRDAHFNLAVLLGRSKRGEESQSHLERVATLDPDYAPAQMLLGRTLAERGDLGSAQRRFASVLERDPAHAEAHYWLAMAQLAENGGDALRARDAAEGHLRQARRLAPAWPLPVRALAQLLARGGNLAAAAIEYQALLELSPLEPPAHLGLAQARILTSEYRAAITGLEEALASSDAKLSRHPRLLDLTARLLATCPDPAIRDGARAEILARRVMGAAPNLDAAETLAMALAEQGRFEEAVQLQREVLERERQSLGQPSPARQAHLARYLNGEPVRAPWLP